MEDRMLIYKFRTDRNSYKKDIREFDIKKLLKVLKESGFLQPIHHGDYLTYASTIYQEDIVELETLEYNPDLCTRLKMNEKVFKKVDKFVFYADCETSTDQIHSE
jgi:hypothetical protein